MKACEAMGESQVYASAVPVNAYVNGIGAVSKSFGDAEQREFQAMVAEVFLVAQYYASLRVAGRAADPKSKVLWMPLGEAEMLRPKKVLEA